ncbi:caspase family protein [Bosea sp. 685]|uniref:caspase family protein n=1 Tax=Bosea sp. 685 TaxID=3080057 RepID=UPI002892EA2F|nr:caspase family protein [Bosea sp. 685]WNJ89665.1 caspase family protein [Bosea sp. 685]
MPGLHLLRLVVVALCVAVGFSPGQAQQLEKRIALVIGNGAYQASPLATPANDAGLIAQTLQAAGFDVVGARDLDTATLRSSLREFLDKASASGPDTVALVYFAGNALQFEGENYLVPVDARIARDADVPLEAVRLSDLTKPLAALPLKARIVVLDAAYANGFARSGQPLAGGLALMQPDPGTLLAFNAAPGTIGPENKGSYGAYASALSEMIKEGGLPLDDLFERVRLRVDALTHGAELPWQVSRVQAPFLFFERTQAAPQAQAVRFSELRSRPIRDFDAGDAYLAALTRDTMRGYLDFLAAYPSDPLAKRVRAIVAARREAATWRESAFADTPDAYWSYLRRYPSGPHAYDARRRLAHFAAVLEPPASFAMLAYDVPPPPPEEVVYVERPVVYFADPIYDLPPPPPVPVFFLPPRPAYFIDLPPPPPPVVAFVLPIPVYHPVAAWIERPAYVAPPPLNVVNVNIHNTVVINQANQTAIVTNPAGQQVAPIPANLLPPQPAAPTPAPGTGPSNFIQEHPVASAAIAAAAVALPAAAALHAAGQRARPVNAPGQPPIAAAPQATAPSPAAPTNNTQPGARPQMPAQAAPAPAANLQPQAQPLPGAHPQPLRPGQAPALPAAPGAQPLPTPNAPAAAGHNTSPQIPGVAQTPAVPARGTQPAPNATAPAQANPQAISPAAPGARPLPTPNAPASAGRTAPPQIPGVAQTPNAPVRGAQPAPSVAAPAQANPQAPHPAGQATQPAAPATITRPSPSPASPPQAVTNDATAQRQQQAAQQRAQQAAQQQQAAQAAAQQRAQQVSQQQRQQQAAQAAAQQRAQQAAQQQQRQQQAAQAAAQQRAQQAAQQQQRQQQAAQAAAQQHAQQAAQQRQQQAAQAQQQATQQRARQAAQQAARPRPAPQQQKRPNCGHPGEPVCH